MSNTWAEDHKAAIGDVIAGLREWAWARQEGRHAEETDQEAAEMFASLDNAWVFDQITEV